MDHHRETTKRYALPPHVKKRGAALLEQQMWCWGQDIRCPEENLLLRYGFTRVRPPEGISGSSAYMLHQDDDHTMTLWGFGLFYAQRSIGGIFIRRFAFTPLLTHHTQLSPMVWSPEDIPELHLPRKEQEYHTAYRLLEPMLLWMSTYEQWIDHCLGPSYRRQCLTAWKTKYIPPEQVASEWVQLAESVKTSLHRPATSKR